ncbi:molybdenum cofactor guanylyltransferase [uncultured Arthrobacter sp.]|uniref:molybdenum cofactor guanylyltransferase n=1 Tax=uncultured Arthrobacter sp. TaxID=114050 RepID=UPI002609AEB0|nr:NTP transferase domain-containing protein [uncultured Arthrobacter sp.]
MSATPPDFDAIVLAGGRSSRLGGLPKAGLVFEGRTLLERTCAALAGARRLVVVGPDPDGGRRAALAGAPTFVREEPAFAGPAAAVVAGVEALTDPAPWCAVVACDMPRVDELVPLLLAAAAESGTSVMAVEGGRDQPLAALYRSADLAHAIDALLARGAVENLSMRSLLASVRTREVPVPPGVTHDVDTFSDARQLGVDVP